MKKKRMLMAVLCVCLIGSVASAGLITSSTTAPTDYFASGGIDGTGGTKIFADGNRADGNEGRGSIIKSDTADSLAGGTLDALVIRSNAAQSFTNATFTLWVFEGNRTMWDAGDGQGDGDLFDETGITNKLVDSETFTLNGSLVDGEYVTLTLASSITMTAELGFFIKLDDTTTDFSMTSTTATTGTYATDGYQLQADNTQNKIVGNQTIEYYAIGTVPEPATMALLGLGSLIAIRRKR